MERGMKEYFSDGKSEALLDEMNSCVSSLRNGGCPPKGPWVTNQREKAWEIIAEYYKGLLEEKISQENGY